MKQWLRYLFLVAAALFLMPGCDGDDEGITDPGSQPGPGMMGNGGGMMQDGFEDGEQGVPNDMGGADMPGAGRGGTAWGSGAFESNGERIYFTGTSSRTGDIPYRGGPDTGMMMMGADYSCASCHGPDARGGVHRMHMEVMDAPNIRWDELAAHTGVEHSEGEAQHAEEGADHAEENDYTLGTFQLAVVAGQHPSGEPLSEEMPRWEMTQADLEDLANYLKSLSGS